MINSFEFRCIDLLFERKLIIRVTNINQQILFREIFQLFVFEIIVQRGNLEAMMSIMCI